MEWNPGTYDYCREYPYYQPVGQFTFTGRNQNIALTPAELRAATKTWTGGEYQQHFEYHGKWGWMTPGCSGFRRTELGRPKLWRKTTHCFGEAALIPVSAFPFYPI